MPSDSRNDDGDDSGAEQEQKTPRKRIKSAKNVAARVCDWVICVSISRAIIIYSNQQNYINSTLLASQQIQHAKIVEQDTIILNQQKAIDLLQQQQKADLENQQKSIDLLRGTVLAQQQHTTELIDKVEKLEKQSKHHARGRPPKVEQYEQFTQFMADMVLQMQSTGNVGEIKTANPIDGLAQRVASMVEQQR